MVRCVRHVRRCHGGRRGFDEGGGDQPATMLGGERCGVGLHGRSCVTVAGLGLVRLGRCDEEWEGDKIWRRREWGKGRRGGVDRSWEGARSRWDRSWWDPPGVGGELGGNKSL
jgi:hypothetical protein